ncbi:MAG: efflux RND transporter permease subunit [Acidiferrobacterales bacterium]
MAETQDEKNGGGSGPLNIAGRITDYFIDSKMTILVIIVALLAGLLALKVTPREENPQIVVPAANIIVTKPGASPKEVEQLIVKPLEAILQGLNGVEHTYGTAMDSMGVVNVQFYVGQNKEDSLVKLYDRIMSNLDRMPPGTNLPLVKPVDVDDVPIITIALSSATMDDRNLRRIADDVLEHLRRVEGASLSFIHGGRARQINVNFNLDAMHRYNVTLLDIRRILEATNVDIPAGTLMNNGTVSTVISGGMLRNAADVRDLVVSLYAHRPVYLKDVATVTDGPGAIKHVHRIGYGPAYTGVRSPDFEEPAVTIAIAKRKGTNSVTVADRVIAELQRIRASTIPAGVHVDITRNDGERANDAVNTLIEHLAIAIGTVVVLLIAFLGWRAASIVTITIPLILFITLAVGMVVGQSINRITLFALILSLGLLVDDSIVVIENIFRHYSKKGVDRMAGAVRAVNEIGRPTNLATLTVILAFLPMFWVTGMMGPYMAPIPFNVPVAMITSLAIAYTVAPWAACRWLRLTPGQHVAGHSPGWLERRYAAMMGKLLDSRRARIGFFLGIALLMVLVLAMPAMKLVLFKMLPKDNTNTFNITVDMPAGTALEVTDRVVRRVGDIVRKVPDVTDYEATVGEPGIIDFNGLLRGAALKQGPQYGEVRVNLRSKHDRSASSIEIVRNLRPAIARLAAQTGANIKLVEDPPGPPVRATILAELYGPNYSELRRIAKELRTDVFAKTPDVVDIDDSTTADTTEYRIVVDHKKAALAGILPVQVAETLQAFLGGYDAGTVHIDKEKEPVLIRFQIPVEDRVQPSDLRKIFFTNNQGNQVSLADIATIEAVTAPQPILHKDQRPVVYVTGEMGTGSQVYAVLSMWRYLRTHPLPDGVKLKQYFMADPHTTGYSVHWDGEMRLTLDVFRDLGSAFGVAILLIYLVLVGYYRSFSTPLIVMGAIPLTIIGVFPGHAVMDLIEGHYYFTATSMIGVIALAGIVVRNSLLLIDFILDFRRSGHDVREAVLQAGITRMRPILLTALAIIFGTAVMVADPVFGGLAVSLISGTFASTVLSLFVIPLVYYMYEGRKARKAAGAAA